MIKHTPAILFFAFLSFIPPALADICLPEGQGNTCTANDFTLTESLASGPTSCTEGEIIPGGITLRVGMEPTANKRYDIGVFVGNSDQSPIGGNSCTFSSLSPLEPTFDGLSGSGPYRELDGNACGDTLKSDGEVFHTVVLTDVLCKDENNDGKLDLSYALTWKSSAGSCPDPLDPENFISLPLNKCVEWVGDIDEIIVIPPPPEPAIRVNKTVSPNVIHFGGDVSYTVSVQNEGVVTVELTSLQDDKFGDLDGQGTCTLPQTIDAGNSYICVFNRTLPNRTNELHTNTVTASAFHEDITVEDSDSATVDVIDPSTGSIGQLVWRDLNGDGIYQTSEPGIDGVTIDLKDVTGTVIKTATTALGGAYSFLSLSGDTYQVVVTDKANILNKLVLTGGVEPHDVILTPTQIYTEANFGYTKATLALTKTATPFTLYAPGGLVKYAVVVANTGPLDIQLFELFDNKFFDLDGQGTCIARIATPQLIPVGASYQCEFEQTITGSPGDTHTNTLIAVAGDFHGHTLVAANNAEVHFIDSSSGAIGNFVWHDRNGDGIPEIDEPGIDHVTLELWEDSNSDGNYDTFIAEDSTLGAGHYDFLNLPAGDYQVRVTDIGEVLRGTILTGGPEPHNVSLAPGTVFANADFGYDTEPLPEIETSKAPSPSVIKAPGEKVTFTYEITNIGQTDVVALELIDSQFGNLEGLGDCGLLQSVLVGKTYSCTFDEFITGATGDTHTNTIATSAEDANGRTAHSTAAAEVLIVDPKSSSIGDLIWNDINANGLVDTGETGIPNVTVALTQTGITAVVTATTGPSGIYNFTNLAAGTYAVQVTDTNKVLTGKVLTGGTAPHNVNLGTEEIYVNADFGYSQAVIEVLKIGDPSTIFEPGGLVSYTITVNNRGFLPVTLKSLIDDVFGDLNGQGDCVIPQIIAVGASYSCSFDQTISGNAGDQHSNTVTANAIDDDGNNIEDDASFLVFIHEPILVRNSAIGFIVWDDENADGVKQDTEPGLRSVTIELRHDSDSNGSYETVVSEHPTLANGLYLFANLEPGDYQVNVTDVFGIVAGMTLTGGTEPHLVSLGDHKLYLEANFGYHRPIDPSPRPISIVGVLVWDDKNADGKKDSLEPGISSVTLDLMRDTNIDGNYDTVVATTTTQVEGYYVFKRLPAGDYQVRVTDRNGVVLNSTLTGGVEPHPLTLGDKQLYPTANFGYFRPPTPSVPAAPIPTLSLSLLSVMAGLLALLSVAVIRRRV